MSRRKAVVGVVTLAVAAFAGGAYAATERTANPRQAFLNDVAKRLNVTPQQLSAALKAALMDRLDAAVKAGRSRRRRPTAIEQRLESRRGDAVPARAAALRAGVPTARRRPWRDVQRRGNVPRASTRGAVVARPAPGADARADRQARTGSRSPGCEHAMTAAVKARLDNGRWPPGASRRLRRTRCSTGCPHGSGGV